MPRKAQRAGERKYRTKPMEILAGENACYRLMAFLSLREE
jgi:hypothetical protein